MSFFRRKARHPLIIIILLLMVVGAVVFLYFDNLKKASAEWFDSSWYYRYAVNISNAGSNQTDYQVSITLDTATLISAGKMQSDCDDIRVTDVNGKILSHWIEGASGGTLGCNNASTKIWTKVPSVPTSGQTVYIYYGNPNATNVENGNNVFLFFDDFESNSLSNWNVAQSGAGVVSIDSTTALETKSAKVDMGTSVIGKLASITTKTSFSAPFIIEQTARRDHSPLGMSIGATIYNASTSIYGAIGQFGNHTDYPTQNKKFTSGGTTGTYVGSDDVWYKYISVIQATSQSTNIYSNYGVSLLDTINTSTTLSQTANLSICWNPFSCSAADGYAQDRGILNVDNVFVRKYAATPPTNSAAAEEKGLAPMAYWKFDEGQGNTTYDDSSNNNDGTRGGGTAGYMPTWQAEDQCVSGKCLKFDGVDDYVGLSSPIFSTTDSYQPYSAFAWIKTTDSDGGIITQYSGSGSSTRWGFRATANLGYWKGGSYLATSTKVINDGNWHFVGFTKDSSRNIKLYIDGAQDGTGTDTLAFDNFNTTIGQFGTASIVPLAGFIDDVKIYPYARTASQIQADYNSRNSTSGSSASIGTSNQLSSALSNGLVGYWKMDDNVSGDAKSLVDSSSPGNTGTTHYGANTTGMDCTVAGKFGTGCNFDGVDDYVSVIDNAAFKPTGAITLSAWINATTPTSNYQMIIDRQPTGGNYGYTLRLDSTTGKILFRTSGTSNSDLLGNTVLSASTWYHVLGVYDGSTSKLYINGVLDNSQSNSGSLTYDASNLAIGRRGEQAAYYFYGKIDEARIYNRALSSKEILDLYNWAPGPVGWWKMDDQVSGNSQTLVDSSAYGNTGTTHYGANATGMNCKIIGKYGGGCLFDGVDDYVSTNLTHPKNYTFTAWLKPVSSGARQLFINDASGAEYWERQADKTLVKWIYNGSVYASVSSGSTTVNDGIWTNVATTYNGSVMKMYINGIDVGTTNTSIIPIPGSVTDIGANVTTYPFNGSIDDVRIYNYARTQKQIAEDMNAGHPSVGSPVGSYSTYWKFDEGYGDTAYDQSVNSNNGDLAGSCPGASTCPAWTSDGKFGKALSFDGSNDYVSSNLITPTSSGNTISVWFNLSRSSSKGYGQAIFYTDATSYPYILLVEKSGNLMIYAKSLNPSYDIGYSQYYTSVAPVTVGKWYHFVAAQTLTSQDVYLNGQLVLSRAFGTVGDASHFRLGWAYWGVGSANQDYLGGLVDEVKVYPFALTTADIQTEYNRGKALAMGSRSDTSGLTGGSVASNSASAQYCIPGDTTSCNSPVGEWNFNENVSGNSQTIYDISGNGNNGTTNWGANASGMNCRAIGKYSSACQFDGVDDYVSQTLPAAVRSSTTTFEAWAKWTSGAGVVVAGVPTGAGGDGRGFAIGVNGSGNAYVRIGEGDGSYYTLTGNTAMTAGAWNHIAATFDDTTATIYLNGTYDGSGNPIAAAILWTDNGSAGPSPAQLYFSGDRNNTAGTAANQGFFNGSIDDVRIFNYVRTPAQVAWDYNKGKPLAWWKFNECQGTTANDSSGNGNSGTVTIGTTAPQTTVGTCTDGSAGSAWYNGRTGKFNSAIGLDGIDDYVSIPTQTIFGLTTGFTLSQWVNVPTNGGQTRGKAIIGKSDGNSSGGGWLVMQGGTTVGADKISVTLFDGVVPSPSFITTKAIPLNQWVLLTATWNGTTAAGSIKIYYNGVAQAGTESDYGTIPALNALAVTIGEYATPNVADYFNGKIDDVKIYNYPLTPAQIKLEYNQGAAVRFGPTTGRP